MLQAILFATCIMCITNVADIDECTLQPELCQAITGAQCTNTEGSYDCTCKVETQKIEDGQCVDVTVPEADSECHCVHTYTCITSIK